MPTPPRVFHITDKVVCGHNEFVEPYVLNHLNHMIHSTPSVFTLLVIEINIHIKTTQYLLTHSLTHLVLCASSLGVEWAVTCVTLPVFHAAL